MNAGRPGLLISVRSGEEAEAALAGGADLIDVKEPARGPLGAADPAVWGEVLRALAGRAPVSAALGELLDGDAARRARAAGGVRFAKFGFARCRWRRDWQALWQAAADSLPSGVLAVPAAYADWQTAEAPPLPAILELAQQSPARMLLIDTFEKRGRTLLDVLTFEALEAIAHEAACGGVRLVLAGSLTAAAIERLLPLAPAWFGVRGAACRGGRGGTIDSALVKSLAKIVICRPHSAAV
jgi:uncharacterized protein (UPF0264 family)